MPAAQAQAEQEVLEKTMMNGVRLSDKLRCEGGPCGVPKAACDCVGGRWGGAWRQLGRAAGVPCGAAAVGLAALGAAARALVPALHAAAARQAARPRRRRPSPHCQS